MTHSSILKVILTVDDLCFTTCDSPVQCVRLSSDMKSLAVACGTTVHIYNAVTGQETWLVS